MADIVLNTNAFRLLLDEKIINRIVRKRVHIFVAKCAWRKELRGVFRPQHLINLLHSSVKKLGKSFHVKKVNENILPNNLKRELVRNHADNCDMEIANLAYDRCRKSGQRVYLISNDPHFQNCLLFGRYRIDVKSLEQFKAAFNCEV